MQSTRYLKYGMASCWRQVSRYRARFIISLLSLTILFGLFAAGSWVALNAGHIMNKLGDAYHASVYLSPNILPEAVTPLQGRICLQTFIKKCEFRSIEDARKRFVERYPDLGKTLEKIQSNPFPASIEVDLQQGKISVADMNIFLANIRTQPGVESVESSLAWLAKWEQAIVYMNKVLRGVGVALLFLVSMVLANTMTLLVLFHKDEIEILNLMGASSRIMILPFMLQSALVTLFSSIIAPVGLYLVHVSLNRYFLYKMSEWFGTTFVFFKPQVVIIFVVGAMGLSAFAAWVSCHRVIRRLEL